MKEQRIEQIKDYIAKNKTVTIDALCSAFDVSRNTVHRDLNMLAKRGVVKKIYGGVVYEQAMETIQLETRSIRNQEQKMRNRPSAGRRWSTGDSIFSLRQARDTCFYQAPAQELGLTICYQLLHELVHVAKGQRRHGDLYRRHAQSGTYS
jgi:DeoR/GlpR family transcriptional regulator of sugar metabolism